MAKKVLNSNPALDFFSTPAPQESAAEKPAEPVKAAPQTTHKQTLETETPAAFSPQFPMKAVYVETKSKRLQLLMQPSLAARIAELAKQQGTSVNNYIHEVLEKHCGQMK